MTEDSITTRLITALQQENKELRKRVEAARAKDECVAICRDFVKRSDEANLDSPYTCKRCERALARLDAE